MSTILDNSYGFDSDYESLLNLKSILDSKSWIFAKTMKSNPHWYTLRKDWGDDWMFDTVVNAIRKMGEEVIFYGKPYIIYRIDEWRYWTMGAPIGETTLINRAKSPIKSEYDDIAWKYDGYYSKPGYQEENNRLATIVQKLPLKGNILDVGCGTGILLDLLLIHHHNYLGIDPSSKMLERLRQKHPQHRCLATKFEALTDSEFNSIVALFGAASYVKPSAWKRINQQLVPNGKYLLMFYRDDYTPDIIKLSRYSHTQALPFLPNPQVSHFNNYVVVQGHV